ncbi:MAG: sulfite exporter TauE/SafE family protein [Steroidobacteraceae bacterium]
MAISFPDLLIPGLLLLGASAIAGVVAGLLGVGGGIVIVPVFYHVFTLLQLDDDAKMKIAVATSLAGIIPTSLASMRAHFARGAVDTQLLRDWGPWIAFGVLVGTVLAAYVRGAVLTGVFATVAVLVALQMAFTAEGTRIRDRLPTGAVKRMIATLIGGISAMMGIGGGTLTVPVLSLSGYPIRRAVATASVIGLIIAIPGTIGFIVSGLNAPHRPPLSVGYVNLAALALTIPAMTLLAPVGARLAHSIDVNALRKAFAVFLAATAARMFYGLLT